MPLVAFAVAVAYWPGFYYPGEAARWIAFSALLWPALAFAAPLPRSPVWWAGAGFLLWAAAGLLWTISLAETWHALWKLALFAGAVVAGASVSPRVLKWTLLAFAVGLAVNGAIAIGQMTGWNPVVQTAVPAGLFVNRNGLAAAGLLAVIIVLHYRAWWLLPLCLASAALPMSRGVALAAIVTGFVWAVRRGPRWLALTLAAGAVALPAAAVWYEIGRAHLQSVVGRALLWSDTLSGLTFFGYGGGTFELAYPMFVDKSGRYFFGLDILPATPHNDVLLVLSEYGAGAFLLFAFVGMALWRGRHDAGGFYPMVAFLALGTVSFPFQQVAPGFVACLCLGALVRAGSGLCPGVKRRGDPLYGGHEHTGAIGANAVDPARRGGVSVRGAHQDGGGDVSHHVEPSAAAGRFDGPAPRT